MVSEDLLNRLISLIKQGIVTYSQIKLQEYKDAVIVELKAEVVDGTITAEQYKTYAGMDYVA